MMGANRAIMLADGLTRFMGIGAIELATLCGRGAVQSRSRHGIYLSLAIVPLG